MSEEQKVEAVEELTKVNPSEAEKALLEEELQRQHKFDPMEAAAKMFFLYLPKYKQLVDKLSSNQMRRLLKALVEVPLQNQAYKHPTEEEKTAFLIGDRLLQSKFLMILNTYDEMAKKAEEQKVASELQSAEQPATVATEGESNG